MNLNIDAGKGGKKQKIQVDAPGKKKKTRASLESKKAKAGWIFVLPFLLGFVLIYLPIIFDSIKYSFNEIKILVGGGYRLEFVGWKNYSDALLVDTSYVTTLVSGLRQLILDIPSIVIFSLSLATSFRRSMTCRLVSLSSAPVGSSARRISGSFTSARAIATRCICPPDIWLGRLLS